MTQAFAEKMEQLNLQQQQAEPVAAASTRIATVVVRQASQKPTTQPSAPSSSHPAAAVKANISSRQTTYESALMGSDGCLNGGFDGRVRAAACEGMTVMLQPLPTEALLVDTTIPVTEVKNLDPTVLFFFSPQSSSEPKTRTKSTDEWPECEGILHISLLCSSIVLYSYTSFLYSPLDIPNVKVV